MDMNVLHGEGRRSLATPRYQNDKQPSIGHCGSRKKQCKPNETKPNSYTIPPSYMHMDMIVVYG